MVDVDLPLMMSLSPEPDTAVQTSISYKESTKYNEVIEVSSFFSILKKNSSSPVATGIQLETVCLLGAKWRYKIRLEFACL